MCDRCRCKTLLEREDIAVTDLRRYVIRALTFAKRSLTPPEILKQVRRLQPINKVTLYRILSLLEEKGIIRKILTYGEAVRYDLIDPSASGKPDVLPYFICRGCNTVIPVDLKDVRSLVEKRVSGKFSGPFELTIEGICLRCKRRAR